MTIKGMLNILLSLALGLLFIWLTFRGLDVKGLKDAFGRVEWWYILLYLAVLTGIQFARTVRWGVMLEPVKRVDFRTLYKVSSVGFMALVLLPFRLGEFARPVLIRDKAGVSLSAAMATIVVERILDAVTISVVLCITLLVLISGGFHAPGWLVSSGLIFFLVFMGLLLVCVFMYAWPAATDRMFRAAVGWASAGLAEKLIRMSRSFVTGLKVLSDWRRNARIFTLSMIYWGLNATGLYIMFLACDLKNAATGEQLPYIAAYALLCMQVVGITIPSGPAFTGPFDYFTAITVSMFAGLPHAAPQVQLYVILVHTVQLLQQSLYGLVYVLTGYVSFGSLLRRSPTLDEFAEPT